MSMTRDKRRTRWGIVLLVEDDPSDELLTLRAFRRHGLANEVAVVRDGAEALDWLNATGPYAGRDADVLPALVLLDLQLPRLNGLEVLRRMREDERLRSVPVVILTSSLEEVDLVRAYRLGANSYVRKPVDFDQFIEAVRELGLYWLVLNELPE